MRFSSHKSNPIESLGDKEEESDSDENDSATYCHTTR